MTSGMSTWDTDAAAPQHKNTFPCIDSGVVEWTENIPLLIPSTEPANVKRLVVIRAVVRRLRPSIHFERQQKGLEGAWS